MENMDARISEDFGNKQRKKYFLFVYSSHRLENEALRSFERVLASHLSGYILIKTEEPDEALKALLVKNIEIVFIHSSFFNDDSVAVEFAAECKKRKKCPIIFSALNPHVLIKEYKNKLNLYHEMDDYFSEPIDLDEMKKKFEKIGKVKPRAAKRFLTNMKLEVFCLGKNIKTTAELVDISLVGFSINAALENFYSMNEQIQIKIPLKNFKIFHELYGDFFKLSGKVKRISINGENIGCSLEYLTTLQSEVLILILEYISSIENMKKVFEYTSPLFPKRNNEYLS